MRICVWNLNGNAAKSTDVNFVFYPRMPRDTEVFYVDSGNSNPGKLECGKDIDATTEDWADLVNHLSMNAGVGNHVIVDIGSNDSKKSKALFMEFHGSLDEFDMFIVPHSPDCKPEDTALTIQFLRDKGIPASKIRMIFNIIPTDSKIAKIFPSLYQYQKETGNFLLNEKAVVYKSGLFIRLKGTDVTVESLLNDDTDWKQKIVDAHPKKDDPKVQEAITYYGWMHVNKMMALSLVEDFDKAFAEVFAGTALTSDSTPVKLKKEKSNV